MWLSWTTLTATSSHLHVVSGVNRQIRSGLSVGETEMRSFKSAGARTRSSKACEVQGKCVVFSMSTPRRVAKAL